MGDGELQKRLSECTEPKVNITHTCEKGKVYIANMVYVHEVQKILAAAKRDFYRVWNEAYGSASQQGLDVYNKWFVKWFGA